MRGASAVAPRYVERKAAAIFSTPRRKTGKVIDDGPQPIRIAHGSGELAAWARGVEGAPTALLVHGWEESARQWTMFVDPLIAAGFRVVLFDQPAHGLSTGKRANILDFRDAVVRVAEKLGPVSAILGHSLGATACALALAQGLVVRCVALLAPAREPTRYVARIADMLGLPAARRDGMLALVRRQIGPFDELDLTTVARARREPALIVHSTSDRMIPFEEGQAVAAAWPGSEFLCPAGLGHRRLLRDPEVIKASVDFVVRTHARTTEP